MRKKTKSCVAYGVVCLASATLCTFLAVPGSVPAKPPKDKGGGSDKDLPVVIAMDPGGLTHDGGMYFDSERRVQALVGRNRGIWLILDERSDRTLVLTLGSRLAEVDGDPELSAEYVEGALPDLPPEGVTGQLEVAAGTNVLRMGEPGEELNPNYRGARLRFQDIYGQEWRLLWGYWDPPDGIPQSNPAAPLVEIWRLSDAAGLINAWDVTTQRESPDHLFRPNAATAFLWRDVPPHGARHYWGAYDASFAYLATEEP